jgi:hypothetical protein
MCFRRSILSSRKLSKTRRIYRSICCNYIRVVRPKVRRTGVNRKFHFIRILHDIIKYHCTKPREQQNYTQIPSLCASFSNQVSLQNSSLSHPPHSHRAVPRVDIECLLANASRSAKKVTSDTGFVLENTESE